LVLCKAAVVGVEWGGVKEKRLDTEAGRLIMEKGGGNRQKRKKKTKGVVTATHPFR